MQRKYLTNAHDNELLSNLLDAAHLNVYPLSLDCGHSIMSTRIRCKTINALARYFIKIYSVAFDHCY
jgi:hypothetical protein